jgi:hypothetical protein
MNAMARGMISGVSVLIAASGPAAGKLAFVGVFVLLLIWLVAMPGRLIGQTDGVPPWWRNARWWAIAVTAAQIAIYLRWG